MARAKLKFLLSCGVILALHAPAAIPPRARSDVLQLGARLNSLEKELGQQNDRYLAAVEAMRELETELTTQQQRLEAARLDAVKREEELAQILRAYHLAVVEDEAVPDERYSDLLKLNRAKASAALKEAEEITKQVAAFQARLANLRSDSEELQRLTVDLQNRKAGLSETYLSKLAERERQEARQKTQRIARIVKEERVLLPKPAMQFMCPIEEVAAITPSQKGVTIKFTRLQPIKAPRAGRVAYNGELASYGKVLMLDHGDDIRTVILGRFRSDLTKDAQVSAGDNLGHTEQDGDSLYFEVRKKNIAQNTIHWLVSPGVGKI
jgi:murein DD-endopeptidase MepM/ murein hydrolase activator NlpD